MLIDPADITSNDPSPYEGPARDNSSDPRLRKAINQLINYANALASLLVTKGLLTEEEVTEMRGFVLEQQAAKPLAVHPAFGRLTSETL